MAKHTPGPWHIPKDGPNYVGTIYANGRLVADVAIPRQVNDEERNPGESWLQMRQRTDAERKEIFAEQDANRALVAAAPDLLAALQSINDYWKSGNFTRREELWAPMRAAIAKATGEPQ